MPAVSDHVRLARSKTSALPNVGPGSIQHVLPPEITAAAPPWMTAALCSRRDALIACTTCQVRLAGSYSSAAVMPLQHPPALPPARSTRSPLSRLAVWSDPAVARFPTAVHVRVAGS